MVPNVTFTFRGNNRLPQEMFLLPFEDNLRNILLVFLCSCFYYQAALAFLAVVLWRKAWQSKV
jgi:hypothetical protein